MAFLWDFIFKSSIIIEHYFISYFIAVVYSFTIFEDVGFYNASPVQRWTNNCLRYIHSWMKEIHTILMKYLTL